MRWLVVALCLLAGCGDDSDNRSLAPPPPGSVGSGGSGGSTGDGSVVDGPPTTILGSICVIGNQNSVLASASCVARSFSAEAQVQVLETGIAVAVDTSGHFEVAANPAGASTLVFVPGSLDDMVEAATVVVPGINSTQLATFEQTGFMSMLSNSSIAWDDAHSGFVFAFMTDTAGLPVQGLTAQSVMPPAALVYYDQDTGLNSMSMLAPTGQKGVIAVNAAPGVVSFQVTRPSHATLQVSDLPSVSRAVSIVFLGVP